ncbi:hypothetical protein Plim_1078 [Planctopirus limnophila DSM 3776]|uniref:Tellurite resistance protein TerB n=1 Tax=Planctopirus limnophila (strain ATCC 43296 / DSM 3776 / IFAM 1008 / Mu 290) TaxID=521674 RepID=D5STT0_PLAL2|nr:TerB N-terminal domain-containing protein [Planctopirus limnophila]ADG66915.1 hypothetical protein Plim_1078 [Planctopirus limnophila DSM 3776]
MEPFVELWRRVTGAQAKQEQKRSSGSSRENVWDFAKRTWNPKPQPQAKFYDSKTKLLFDRGQVVSPLVYVFPGIADAAPDASLIETGLPVAPSGTEAEDLPYWPSYRGSSPAQRSRYLDWLIGGRSDPAIPLGYVFIYFYGLERRVLIDGADHTSIAEELIRLLKIYSSSRSFRQYGTSLLWATIWLSLKSTSVTGKVMEQALETGSWSEQTLNTCLACFAKMQAVLPTTLVHRLVENDVRTPRSVISQRHAELHRDSFERGLRQKYPDGFRLRTGRRDKQFEYYPASATLGRLQDSGGPLAEERIPNVLGLNSQLQPLIDVCVQTNEELKAYDRAHRKSNGSAMTAEMYESLPEHLRGWEHPHFKIWHAVMNRHVTEDGWTVVPIGELAKLEGISERKKLTKSQSMELALTATHMRLALEPDPRLTGKAYDWDQPVNVFPASEELSEDIASYHAAAVVMELGVAIAAADGQIDPIELGRLGTHLETQFQLSAQDSLRLEYLRYLLTKYPPTEFSAARTLQKNLTVPQRKQVGEFLVGIAAADEVIDPAEVKALGKAYRALGLETSDLKQLLQSISIPAQAVASTAAQASETFQLDLNRINAIMTETAKVTQFLRDALREDFEVDNADVELPTHSTESVSALIVPVATSQETLADSRFEGLSSRLVPFARFLIAEEQWPLKSLETEARSRGLMLGAAIEQINEWAFDRLPDALLIEDGEFIVVQRELLPQVRETP